MNNELCEILKSEYGEITTNSGEKVTYLGMDFIKIKDGINLSMEGYIDKILKDKDLVDCKPAMTPGSSNK
jgi:hypothetical protein